MPNPTPACARPPPTLRRIDRRLATVEWAGNLFYGLSLGSVLLLAALGLAITFGLMGVINMAHGELLMIGAYVTYGADAVPRRLRLAGLVRGGGAAAGLRSRRWWAWRWNAP